MSATAPIARLVGPVGLPAAIIALVCGLSSIGLGADIPAAAGVFSAISVLLHASLFSLAYLFAAVGLGRVPARLLARDSESRLWLQPVLGLACMLWISHFLGALGLLSIIGVPWVPLAAGLLLLAHQLIRGDLHPEKWPLLPASALLWTPALAVLLVAAANPPGWLWESEYGAYDALSYHLQLPKEWAAAGTLSPLPHNVYSFLPSYMESAYLHLAQLFPGRTATDRTLGGEGVWVISCQLLHAYLVPVTGLLVARTVWVMLRRAGFPDHARLAAVLAGAAAVSIPWMVVAGSLAYNDAAVVALGAGAVLVAIDDRIVCSRKAAAAGLLVGIACSVKPTSLILLAPLVAIALATHTRPRLWPRSIAAGLFTSLACLAPWLLRNYLACGNAVFPFAAGMFGRGHWTAEQVERYRQVHFIHASLAERLEWLFSSSRGLLHEQWSVALPLAAACLGAAFLWKPTRRLAVIFGSGMLLQVLGWLFLTHLQSRFLLPLAIPFSLLVGLGAGVLLVWVARNRAGKPIRLLAAAVAALAPLSLSTWTVLNFLSQRGGEPNSFLVPGVGVLIGNAFLDTLGAESVDAQREFLLSSRCTPQVFVNFAVAPGLLGDPLGLNPIYPRGQEQPHSVYLLGDATVLYYLGTPPDLHDGVVYHTTWDTSPLGDAIRASSNEPAAWTASLRTRGIGFVFINFDELHRLIDTDHYYDPAVTSELVRAWLTDPAAGCQPIRSWAHAGAPAGTGSTLFRLHPPPTK